MRKILNDKLIGKVLKTFIEGFLASLLFSLKNIENFNNIDLFKFIFIGAIAAGLSAVLNLIQSKLNLGDV